MTETLVNPLVVKCKMFSVNRLLGHSVLDERSSQGVYIFYDTGLYDTGLPSVQPFPVTGGLEGRGVGVRARAVVGGDFTFL